MQFQAQVIILGYKAATYFNKYPGRFISAHLSDWTEDKKEVAIGKGIIDWKEFFNAAKTGGVKNFFVEMKPETFKDSATSLECILFFFFVSLMLKKYFGAVGCRINIGCSSGYPLQVLATKRDYAGCHTELGEVRQLRAFHFYPAAFEQKNIP